MKKFITLIVVVVFVVVAVVTCPDRQQHYGVLKQEMDKVMSTVIHDQVGADDSLFGFGLATIGSTLASKLIENIVESTLEVKDYYVFSTGNVTISGKTKTVSIGFLGHVIPTFDADDVKEAVDKKLDYLEK